MKAKKDRLGCQCPSCNYTNSPDFFPDRAADGADIPGTGFAKWPRGKPAGRRSTADYAAHVAHGRKVWDEKGRLVVREFATFPNTNPAAFYSCPATSPGEVLRVLRQQFGLDAAPAVVAPATVPEFIAAHPEIAAANAASRAALPRAGGLKKRPALAPASGPNIAELLELAIATHAARRNSFST